MFKIKKTGVQEIDVQHDFLIGHMVELHNAIKANATKQEIETLLLRLNYYALTHLGYEEQGMEVLDYPERYNHFHMHKFFREKMADITDKINSGGATVATELLVFLRDWFLAHIEGEDMRYIKFVEKSQLFPRLKKEAV